MFCFISFIQLNLFPTTAVLFILRRMSNNRHLDEIYFIRYLHTTARRNDRHVTWTFTFSDRYSLYPDSIKRNPRAKHNYYSISYPPSLYPSLSLNYRFLFVSQSVFSGVPHVKIIKKKEVSKHGFTYSAI